MLGAWSFLDYEPKKILDVGTGTGLISLMQAQKFENAEIDAVEIDLKAFNESKINFEASPWKNRINAINANYTSQNFNTFYDLILSNPPFYKNSLKSLSIERNFARQEKHLPFSNLFEKTSSIIHENGNFQLILPYKYYHEILELAKCFGFYLNQTCFVFGNVNSNQPVRVLFSFSKSKKIQIVEKLIIEYERGKYTKAYKNLTKDFYLNF